MRGKEVIADWTSKRWHSSHNWHTGTGRFIKRLLNKKSRRECKKTLDNYDTMQYTIVMVFSFIDKKITFDPTLTLQWFVSVGVYIFVTVIGVLQNGKVI